jgi:hypothetical protein
MFAAALSTTATSIACAARHRAAGVESSGVLLFFETGLGFFFEMQMRRVPSAPRK